MSFHRKPARVRQVDEPNAGAPLSAALTLHTAIRAWAAAPARPQPKTVARRNAQLLAMAAGRPCLLRVPGVCNGDPGTTVACHSNLSIHEKGGHRKADDCYSVWGCARCHIWLDSSYSVSGSERARRFMGAHLLQVLEWRRISTSATAPEADRRAAQWALDNLNAMPVAPMESP